jgi:plastocyanin
MPSRLLRFGLLVTACALVAGAAAARQIRVSVSNFAFSPATVTVNAGDHVVWVWTGGTHNVVSGDGVGQIADGEFTSGGVAGIPTTYSWKSVAPTTEPYYCELHAPGMVGTVNVVASGATGLSDFRISEVQFNAAGNLDLVEIENIGSPGNMGRYRLKVSGLPVQTLQIGSSPDLAVPGAGHVVLHCNATGTSTATDLFLPAITNLPANGSIALYVPNTSVTNLSTASQLIDFVQWGAGAQENESVAVAAGLWTAGAAITNVADGHSIERCGDPGQYGAGFWHEISTPNFGSDGNCATPTFSTTWGRIKSLYR